MKMEAMSTFGLGVTIRSEGRGTIVLSLFGVKKTSNKGGSASSPARELYLACSWKG